MPKFRFNSGMAGADFEIQNNVGEFVVLNCIHHLWKYEDISNLGFVRKEIISFNKLMERTGIPSFVWEDRINGKFEYVWQAQLIRSSNIAAFVQTFEQSYLIADALQRRINAQLEMQGDPVRH